jgi:hypothetical protein
LECLLRAELNADVASLTPLRDDEHLPLRDADPLEIYRCAPVNVHPLAPLGSGLPGNRLEWGCNVRLRQNDSSVNRCYSVRENPTNMINAINPI